MRVWKEVFPENDTDRPTIQVALERNNLTVNSIIEVLPTLDWLVTNDFQITIAAQREGITYGNSE